MLKIAVIIFPIIFMILSGIATWVATEKAWAGLAVFAGLVSIWLSLILQDRTSDITEETLESFSDDEL